MIAPIPKVKGTKVFSIAIPKNKRKSAGDQWDEMQKSQRQEAIAFIAGWERGPKRPVRCGPMTIAPMTCWHKKSDQNCWQDNPPAFIDCLDQMHKAEEHAIRSSVTSDKYLSNLRDLCIEAHRATAAQRAKALYMTMKG